MCKVSTAMTYILFADGINLAISINGNNMENVMHCQLCWNDNSKIKNQMAKQVFIINRVKHL